MTLKATAQTLFVDCPCGGGCLDADGHAYMITSDTKTLYCDTCGKRYDAAKALPKTARLFA